MTTQGPVTRQGPTQPYPRIAPERANLATKALRLGKELAHWAKAGAPLTPKDELADRAAVCEACEYYAAGGNLGLGECRAPGCGCTRAKRWLATARCPLSRWPQGPLEPPSKKP